MLDGIKLRLAKAKWQYYEEGEIDDDMKWLIGEVERLQRDNKLYRSTLEKAYKIDGYMFIKETLEAGNE